MVLGRSRSGSTAPQQLEWFYDSWSLEHVGFNIERCLHLSSAFFGPLLSTSCLTSCLNDRSYHWVLCNVRNFNSSYVCRKMQKRIYIHFYLLCAVTILNLLTDFIKIKKSILIPKTSFRLDWIFRKILNRKDFFKIITPIDVLQEDCASHVGGSVWEDLCIKSNALMPVRMQKSRLLPLLSLQFLLQNAAKLFFLQDEVW